MVYEDAPGFVVGWIANRTEVKSNLGKYKWFRSFDWFKWYCVTPPVYPVHVWTPNPEYKKYEVITGPEPKLCCACGKVHITSEVCGVEQCEIVLRDSTVRKDDGYKLLMAKGMGCFDEE